MQCPQVLCFSGTKQKHVEGENASNACSPWKNGSVAWISSQSHVSAGECCWPQKQLQSPDDQQRCQQRARGGAGPGQEEMNKRLMVALRLYPTAEHGPAAESQPRPEQTP